MKKTAILILAVLFLSSGPVFALDEDCERILNLGISSGYSYDEIIQIVSNGHPQSPVSHAEMKARLRRAIREKSPSTKIAKKNEPSLYIIAGDDEAFKFSEELIKVPSDIEK